MIPVPYEGFPRLICLIEYIRLSVLVDLRQGGPDTNWELEFRQSSFYRIDLTLRFSRGLSTTQLTAFTTCYCPVQVSPFGKWHSR